MVSDRIGTMVYINPDWSDVELDNIIRLRIWWVLHYLELTYKHLDLN